MIRTLELCHAPAAELFPQAAVSLSCFAGQDHVIPISARLSLVAMYGREKARCRRPPAARSHEVRFRFSGMPIYKFLVCRREQNGRV